jgi:lipoprotein-anchoring transpeptidase ErfK/SrfK
MRATSILFAVGLAVSALAGCTTGGGYSLSDYAGATDAAYRIPPIPVHQVDSKYLRRVVSYPSDEPAGTIIVDTGAKFLYYVQGDGTAVRYGIGVGREGFAWQGTAHIGRKQEWPDWHAPPEMIVRERKDGRTIPPYVRPGLMNPLGARALYLYNDKGDMGYRLHGSPEWWTIGTAASSGCIRLMNQDIIDLYNRAKVGAKVIVT